jgi:hypothetical protein
MPFRINKIGPTTMDEWQRRMRAEKEAERKKKTESAEILKGYKGGVADADLKLKALREEERKKFADAQQNLHSYKAKEIEVPGGAAHKKQPRQSLPQANVQADAKAEAYKDPLEGMVFGSVQERAAALAAQAEAAASLNGSYSALDTSTTKYGGAQDLSEVETTSHHANDTTWAEPETIMEVPAPAESVKESTTTTTTTTTTTAETEIPSENMEQPPPKEAVSSYTPTAATAAAVEEEKKVESDPVPNEASSYHAIENHHHNKNMIPFRLDILFSFGLVTVQPVPETSRYMDAVQKIVQQALDNSSRDTAAVLDPSYTPFVKDQKVDGK